MKKTFIILAILIFAAAGNVCAQDENGYFAVNGEQSSIDAQTEQNWDARIISSSGSVKMQYVDSDDWINAQENMPLSNYDKIKTGDNSYAEILMDGEEQIRLGENSFFEIKSLDYDKTSFFLKLGSLLGKIKNLAGRERSIYIETPSAVCSVRGTEFGIENDSEGETFIGVFDEGEVSVSSIDDGMPFGEAVLITKNREVRIKRGMRIIKVRKLKRFKRRMAVLKKMRKMAPALKRKWKQLSPKQRKLIRRKAFLKRKTIKRHHKLKQRKAIKHERKEIKERIKHRRKHIKNRNQKRIHRMRKKPVMRKRK